MSAMELDPTEQLRAAAALLRDPYRYKANAYDPALAAWLDATADTHQAGGTEELVLHPEEPCEVCEESGHEVEVCSGCFPIWEDVQSRALWPCAEVKAALPVASLILGTS